MMNYYATKLVKGTVRRNSMLYKTNVEYGDYAMTPVVGCAHGCMYPCYQMSGRIMHKQTKDRDEWIGPVLVENTLELLQKELPRLKSKIKFVTLSFATDPFMFLYPQIASMSLAAISLINSYNIPCMIITKGVLPYDLTRFSKDNFYGITVTGLEPDYVAYMEPGAAPVPSRIHSLKVLHDAGCRTFVSIEPFVTPNIYPVNLNALLESISFVDHIIFGRLTKNALVSQYPNYKEFYNEKVREVINFCQARGITYYIKDKTFTEF